MTQMGLPNELRMVNQKTPKRPTEHDESVQEAAALKVAAELHKWAAQGKPPTDSVDDYLEDARHLIRESEFENDGYALAKSLEDNLHYSPDRALVEICDDAFLHLITAEREAVKKWVADWEITAPLAVGTKVSFTHESKKQLGEITQVIVDSAQYNVFCAELGHIRQGSPWQKGESCRTTGIFLYYYEVTEVK